MTTTWTAITKPTTSWTNVAAPVTSTVGIIAGNPIGLLLALTYAKTIPTQIVIWTDVSKASGTSWTSIPKAT